MNSEEFEKLCDELRAQYAVIAKKEHPDATEDEIEDMCDGAIMTELWEMFADDKIEKEDLIKMAGQLGFEPTEKFKSATGDVSVGEGAEQTIPTEEGGNLKVSEKEIEKAQGYDKDYKNKEEEKGNYESEDEEDEENERKNARKLFGFDDED